MAKTYFYVRPDRDNWTPTVEKCRRQLLRYLLEGKWTLPQAEHILFSRFQNVSNTYWHEFWKEVTEIPVEHAYS